jgi:hypothetical protein
MTAENTRAALPGDLVARLRRWGASDYDTHACLTLDGEVVATVPWIRHATDLHGDVIEAADALAARDAEIARLRAALWAALPHLPGARSISHETPHGRALAALSPPPASDGEKP